MFDRAQSISLRAPDVLSGDSPMDGEAGVPTAYDGQLFVPQTDAYQWLLARVRQWEARRWGESGQTLGPRANRNDAPPAEQVLRLMGERGVGKSWLMKNLAMGDGQTAPVAVYLDLGRRKGFRTAEGFVAAVQAQIDRQCVDGARILLLDSVPCNMDAHLRALEYRLLRPHLTQRRSMVIMALEHPSRDCWRLPTLRGGQSYWLQPFNQAETRAQLERLSGAGLTRYRLPAACLQDYSGGHPLLNYLLVRREQEQAYDCLLDYVLSQIPAERRELVRHCLDAVCVLEVLEQEPMERVLGLHRRLRSWGNGVPAHASQVRSTLREHWLARSVPDAPGRIILVESVRRAARELLKVRDPELFVAINELVYSTGGGAW